MEIITKTELNLRKKEIIAKIKKGAIFIHPTDTIYGIGCNALDETAIKKIRKLKDRSTTPFSVWVPSLKWIKDNCSSPSLEKWLQKLPGSYTLITKLKNKEGVAPSTNPGNKTLGIRMPDHWFHEFVKELGIPIVTTSANKTGQQFMTSLDDLDPEIRIGVDFAVYEGKKKARPSRLIDLTKNEKVTER